MLDGKILSAVLATLTAVAVSTSGGDLSSQSIETNPANMEMDVGGLVQNPLKQLTEMATTTPKPENKMRAELEFKQMNGESLQIEGATIRPDNTTKMEFGGKTVNSDEEIVIYSYSGSVMPANSSVKISGNAGGVLTSGVNVSGTSGIDHKIKADKVVFEGVKESQIALSRVTGVIESKDVSTEFGSERSLTIDSFSGDIILRPENGTIVLDGKVNRLEAGSFTFGE